MGHNYARDNVKARRKRRKKDEMRVFCKRFRKFALRLQADSDKAAESMKKFQEGLEAFKASVMERLRKEGAF